MKHLLVIALMSITPFMAQAVPADAFTCKLTILDQTTGNKNEQYLSFQVARLPLSASPAPDVRLTAGRAGWSDHLDTNKSTIYTTIGIDYTHATKIDSTGHVIDARQRSCISLSSSACNKNNPTGSCSVSSYACSLAENPFDPVNGWSKVSFIGDLPAFQERDLSLVTANMEDETGKIVGRTTLDCTFKGTYQ